MWDQIQIRSSGRSDSPALIYLPGLHGDWTLVGSFKAALGEAVRFVEITYPRTTSWTARDYANGVIEVLAEAGIKTGWLLAESFGSQVGWEILRLSSSQGGSGGSKTGSRPLTLALSPTGGEGSTSPPFSSERGKEDKSGASGSKFSGAGKSDAPPAEAGTPNREWPSKERFCVNGLILAGGFVRHPMRWIIPIVQRINRAIPMRALGVICRGYAFYARFRHRRAPETLAGVKDFIVNRSAEEDRRAIAWRYKIIGDNDFCDIARSTSVPVYQLTGLFDPVVPWLSVRRWLKRNCASYAGWKLIWGADHNVLGSAPAAAARQVLEWMNGKADRE